MRSKLLLNDWQELSTLGVTNALRKKYKWERARKGGAQAMDSFQRQYIMLKHKDIKLNHHSSAGGPIPRPPPSRNALTPEALSPVQCASLSKVRGSLWRMSQTSVVTWLMKDACQVSLKAGDQLGFNCKVSQWEMLKGLNKDTDDLLTCHGGRNKAKENVWGNAGKAWWFMNRIET